MAPATISATLEGPQNEVLSRSPQCKQLKGIRTIDTYSNWIPAPPNRTMGALVITIDACELGEWQKLPAHIVLSPGVFSVFYLCQCPWLIERASRTTMDGYLIRLSLSRSEYNLLNEMEGCQVMPLIYRHTWDFLVFNLMLGIARCLDFPNHDLRLNFLPCHLIIVKITNVNKNKNVTSRLHAGPAEPVSSGARIIQLSCANSSPCLCQFSLS